MQREFRTLSIPFQFATENLFNQFGAVLLYLCGTALTIFLLKDRDAAWWVYLAGSVVWTVACGFGLFALSFSVSIADVFSGIILEKLIKHPSANNLAHRCIHAVIASAIFAAVFGLIMLNWFGYLDDGCDGRYPRC